MTLEEVRTVLNERWTHLNARARELKDSQSMLSHLPELVRGLDPEAEPFARQVITEWLLSGDESKRYDARFLVGKLEMREALSSLQQLEELLQTLATPGAPSELEQVRLLIQRLEGC